MLRPELLAAPGAEDDFGVASDHLASIGDRAAGGALRKRKFLEDILTAGDLDELAHPADAADHRLVPLLEVDARTVGELLTFRSQLRQTVLELRNQSPP